MAKIIKDVWYKLIRICINRYKILSGILNILFKKYPTEYIAKDRLNICRSNICGYYDKHGDSDKAIGNCGEESCAACGCILKIKVRSMECSCGLEELDKEPLWKSVVKPK